VNSISNTLLGKIGGILAILGVVAAPISSGDTAFRSARLIVADFIKYGQGRMKNRLVVSIPLFIVGLILTQIHFDIIWRYFGWANQTLATIVLWAITVYLARENKFYFLTLIPALFMTAVVISYILIVPSGFNLRADISYISGLFVTGISFLFFLLYLRKIRQSSPLNN
jgi:carbon starvation protein CstA